MARKDNKTKNNNNKLHKLSEERRNREREKIFKDLQQAIETLRDDTIKRLLSTHEDILEMNKALIHLMETINNADEGKMSTRELLREMGSHNVHGLLLKGEELGFIKREPDKNRMVNYLSEEGQALLQAAATRHNKTQT
jgi:hypothetical protein